MTIIIVAFRAFVFREVRDRGVIQLGITDRGRLPMTSVRSTHSRPESYDTVVSLVKAIGNHGEICPCRLRIASHLRPAFCRLPRHGTRHRSVTADLAQTVVFPLMNLMLDTVTNSHGTGSNTSIAAS